MSLDEVQDAAGRVAGAEPGGVLSGQQPERLLGNLREPGRHRRRASRQAPPESAVSQGEAGNGELRRRRVDLVEGGGDDGQTGRRAVFTLQRLVAGRLLGSRQIADSPYPRNPALTD
jgi:hypothetical protein